MMPARLSSNEIEAANRGEATALLIRSGYRVYRPEADVAGEDLILRAPGRDLLPVQMKGRPFVAPDQYGGKGIWMLFPDPRGTIPGRDWYLVPHDDLLAIIRERRRKEPNSGKPWSYATIPEGLRRALTPYSLRHRVVSDPEREATSPSTVEDQDSAGWPKQPEARWDDFFDSRGIALPDREHPAPPVRDMP